MITDPYSYTRRFFKKEEVIISSCNNCFSVVAESGNDADLEALEQHHSCGQKSNLGRTIKTRDEC